MSNEKDAIIANAIAAATAPPADLMAYITNAINEEKKKGKVKNLKVDHEGTKIILPIINGKPMSYDDAIEWMKRKKAEDEAETNVLHMLPCSPLDGLVAFHRALANIYGWTESVPTPSFFGDRPPTMVSIPIGPNETMQVPFGRMQIPGIDGHLQTGFSNDGAAFVISGVVKKKNAKEVERIAAEAKRLLKEKSIYKGKAIKVDFGAQDDDDFQYDPLGQAPQFMDLTGVNDGDLIFGKKVLDALEIGLFTPIEQSDACRRYKVPLKRGILLYGPYGTGKTMTANTAALKAARNGWTFVYLNSVRDLKYGLEFAARYAPAVLFAEDIDRVMHGDRSLKMDDILNTLDGVDTKGAEIITVFTTNHIENINPAILRMGRLDVLVEVTAPDADAVQRLVQLYGRGLLAKDANLDLIGEALAGNIPAFIREVVERAKMAAIARVNGGNIEGVVLEADLLAAANAMAPHAALLKPKEGTKNKAVELLVRVPPGHTSMEKFIRTGDAA
jgi:transitional endoplasmic reticulum ATPase